VQDLDVIGVKLERNKPRVPLEFFASETKGRNPATCREF